jgi:uncharacterized protein YdgA (DUF945 family)
MKRWIVAALVALAVIVLVSPGIVGRMAERNLKDSIEWAKVSNDDFVVTEETFERGWFTAEGRHRIELKKGVLHSAFAELAGAMDPDRTAALIVDTRIDHGLVPVSSMSRESGSLQPALASTISTLQLDSGDGELIAIPGRLKSRVGLSGETASHYELPAGSFANEELELEWASADIRFTIDASASNLQYNGRVDAVSLLSDTDNLRIGGATFAGLQQASEYGFSVGNIELLLENAVIEDPLGGATGIDRLKLDANNELVGQRVNGSSTLDAVGVSIPGLGEADLGLHVVVNGLDARTLQRIIEEFREARQAADPEEAFSAAYTRIEGDVQAFLQAGAEVRFDRIDLSLPQGDVAASMRFELPQTDGSQAFSWPTLLLALTAAADIRVPVALVEMAQAGNPQANALIAMGILKRDGDTYVTKAEYSQGLLTVNGAPLPIPLGVAPR